MHGKPNGCLLQEKQQQTHMGYVIQLWKCCKCGFDTPHTSKEILFSRINYNSKQNSTSPLEDRRCAILTNLVFRSSRPEVLTKVVLKIYSKFTAEHPCRSAISIKLLYKFFEITLWRECSPVNLLLIFRTHFPRNTSRWLLLNILK